MTTTILNPLGGQDSPRGAPFSPAAYTQCRYFVADLRPLFLTYLLYLKATYWYICFDNFSKTLQNKIEEGLNAMIGILL